MYNIVNTADNGATPLFNGNISETYWETANDNKQRGYSYSYDALNRITSGQYIGNYSLVGNTNEIEDYSLKSISYDKNGNINHLERMGLVNGTSIDMIDMLSYTYEPLSNKLLAVHDDATQEG